VVNSLSPTYFLAFRDRNSGGMRVIRRDHPAIAAAAKLPQLVFTSFAVDFEDSSSSEVGLALAALLRAKSGSKRLKRLLISSKELSARNAPMQIA